MTQSTPADEERKYIGSLADTKELTFSIKWADTEDDFKILIESIRLFESEDTIIQLKLLRMAEKEGEKSIVAFLEKEIPKSMPKNGRILLLKSALQWAASGGYHEVVWWLLQNSLPTKETEQDIEDAKKMAREGKDWEEKAGKNSKPQQQEKSLPKVGGKEFENKSKSERTRNEAQTPLGSYQITLDLLEDPPPFVVTLADLNDEDLTKKNLRSDLQAELKNHKASIVDFYQRDGNFDLLRRRRDVYDVIYSTEKGHGPKDVMESARETLKNIGPQNAREKAYRAEDFKMRWIHLPANNIEWMEDLTKRICKDKKMENSDWSSLNNLLQKSWQELPTSKVETRLMKPMCLKSLKRRRINEWDWEDSGLSTPEAGNSIHNLAGAPEQVMPYIAFGSCHQKDTKTDPSRKSYNNLMEVYKDKVIHETRSLDQFYYHSLVDMPLRDRKTIITSSTHRPDGFDDPVIGKMFRLLREAKQKKNGESPPSSVEELSRFLVTFCVDFINSLRWDEDAPPSIRIREEEAASKSIQLLYMEAINNVAAQEKKLFQRFKRKMEHKEWESMQNNKKSKKDQEVANITQSEEQHYIQETKKGQEVDNITRSEEHNHIQETEKGQEVDNITRSEEHNHVQETQNWSSISEAANLLDEIKDILDELMILKTLLTQQQHVWKELVGPEPERDSARGPTYTLHEIEEMIKMAERLQKSRAEDSSRQGKVLMAFTIVTVVFTPLSFLTSLFSLNITVFEHNSDGDTEYDPGWIFPIIFAVSAGVILPLMIYAAVGLGDLKNAFTKVQNRLVNISNESGKNLIKDDSPSSKAEEGDMAPGNHPTNHEASQFLIWRHRPRWMNRRSGKL
ncbi:hypothetical protein BGAL_0072g00150 [Botrytis galanthina]|uniref:Ankyrin repeat protein n=1 Tax=Botrytis galanthina TaxID=278940 RepID=A0A4S8RDY9_9HELO|nr:hypothetical protein BGAL_0072g00150 [Botrytis galanthina]